MDPISVAASRVGLMTATSRISESLISFIKNVADAPKLAHDVLGEVADISASLGQLQCFLVGAEVNPRFHARLLMMDQIVVVLSNGVMVFSELGEILEPFKTANLSRPGLRARWIIKEPKIQRLLRRLKSSQESMNLLLGTMTCTSVLEAQASVDRLTALVAEILDSNRESSQRMASIELRSTAQSSCADSMISGKDRYSRYNTFTETEDDQSSLTVRKVKTDPLSETSDATNPDASRSFDKDLTNSRPYLRASKKRFSWSAGSFEVRTVGWSFLSGLSLAEISQIAVMHLPLSSQELWDGQ